MDLATTWIVGGSVGLATSFGAFVAVRRALRSRADARALADNVARERDLARSLHPVIDPDICIGSLACLKSCPEGDILGIVNGAARLVHGDHCIGHGRCAAECPVGAIQLVFGSARRGVDLPDVDEFFESSRPGVHVVGELGGMGLIRNAMVQGIECVEHLAEVLRHAPPSPARAAELDLAIVGSGPAGLAAALTARKAGLSCCILEQGSMGGTVAQFPRHKIAMTEPVELPLAGRFGKRRMTKQELLAAFERIVSVGQLDVREGTKVVAIHGDDGAFELETERGRVTARKVLLAIGRRGTPRRLGVPGEEREKVTYALADAEQYRGLDVLVVGGGDAALESAIQLVEPGGARVTLSHRGAELARCREANRARIDELVRAGRVRLLPSSRVQEIREREVLIAVGERVERIRNDYVIVNAGGELPLEMLQKAGVSLRRYHGEAPAYGRAPGSRARGRTDGGDAAQRRADRRKTLVFLLVGAAVLGFLAWHGRDYYLLSPRARMASPLHRSLRSAGPWGHGIGIGATLFMLSNFLYAARKHLAFMSDWGRTRAWLQFHMFVGFMSPLVIAFHGAFQSRNLLASGTATALAVVVLTGIIGRYVYGLVPAAGGRALEVEDLQARFVRLTDEVEPLLATASDPTRVRALLERVRRPAASGSLVGALLTFPFRRIGTRADLLRVRRLFATQRTFTEFRDGYLRLQRLTVQIRFYRSLKALLGAWRLFHASLAVFLVLIIAAHIALSLYLGYGLLRW